jgi:hypothetical protein
MIFHNKQLSQAADLFLQYLFIENEAKLLPGNTKTQKKGLNIESLINEVKDLKGGFSHDVIVASLDDMKDKTLDDWNTGIKAYLKVKKLKLKDIVYFGAIHNKPYNHVHLVIAKK